MSDTIDRETMEDTNGQPEAAAPEGAEAAAADKPAEPAEREGTEDSPAEEPETAVQFPRITPEDAPSHTMEDIPYVEEELPTLEEDEPQNKGKLYDYVAKMDDRQFRRAQTIFGIALGALAALSLMIPIPGEDAAGSSMWNFVIALVIVMWIPRYVERKTEKRLPVAQKWMLIIFVIGMAVSIGVNALQGNFSQPSATSPSPSPEASATPAPSATTAP